MSEKANQSAINQTVLLQTAKSISNHEDPLAKRWVVMPKIKNLANHFKNSHSNHNDLLSINLANLQWMAKFVEPLQVCKKSVRRLYIIYYHIELIYSILTIKNINNMLFLNYSQPI